jgi:hemin uptake protein HemP
MTGAQVMATAGDDHRYNEAVTDHTADKHEKKVRVLVAELLQGGREAILEHAGNDYRLRITANGKLILTK